MLEVALQQIGRGTSVLPKARCASFSFASSTRTCALSASAATVDCARSTLPSPRSVGIRRICLIFSNASRVTASSSGARESPAPLGCDFRHRFLPHDRRQGYRWMPPIAFERLPAPPHHTPDLEGHRKRLREALGNTLSDEFVDVILGKLVEALRPGLYDQLDEARCEASRGSGRGSRRTRQAGRQRSRPGMDPVT